MNIRSIVKDSKKFGDFELSSGQKSDYYYDIKEACLDPDKLRYMASLISARIKESTDKIMGIELGSVMLATMVSHQTDIPTIILRKESKGYGLQNRLEGEIKPGEKIAIIDDVWTTGKSMLSAANYVLSCEGTVIDMFVVINRDRGTGCWTLNWLWDESKRYDEGD